MIKITNLEFLLKPCPLSPTLHSEQVELHPGQSRADTAQAPGKELYFLLLSEAATPLSSQDRT